MVLGNEASELHAARTDFFPPPPDYASGDESGVGDQAGGSSSGAGGGGNNNNNKAGASSSRSRGNANAGGGGASGSGDGDGGGSGSGGGGGAGPGAFDMNDLDSGNLNVTDLEAFLNEPGAVLEDMSVILKRRESESAAGGDVTL